MKRTYFNTELVKKSITDLLVAIEPSTCTREGLVDTPARVTKMFAEIFSGYELDPDEVMSGDFGGKFTETYDELVIVRDIEFYSHCEHHMVPFFGKVHIGYIPNGKVVGLSKLARVVDCFAKRLQVQERMTQEIADTVERNLDAKGVIVVIEATHLCMCMRGVKKPHSSTVTSIVRGLLKENGSARAEFFSMVNVRS